MTFENILLDTKDYTIIFILYFNNIKICFQAKTKNKNKLVSIYIEFESNKKNNNVYTSTNGCLS